MRILIHVFSINSSEGFILSFYRCLMCVDKNDDKP